MATSAVIFLKVKPGAEKEVRSDLLRLLETDSSHRCGGVEGASCLLSGMRHSDMFSRGDNSDPPPICHGIRVSHAMYLYGPFDFALLLEVADVSYVEQFIVCCLRSGRAADRILDTQTVVGVPLSMRRPWDFVEELAGTAAQPGQSDSE